MKFKENFKRFFTLDRHSNAGFTLVELIVVIAILAILAGVAIPVYSGYIAKANEAADYQLLGAINQAYVAACVEKSVVPADGTTLPVSGSKLAVPTGDVWDAFKVYFGDNINTSFKTVENGTLTYVTAKGGFQLPEDGTAGGNGGMFTEAFNKVMSTITGSVTNVQNSTFGTIGAQGLMNKVEDVTGMASDLCDLTINGQSFQSIMQENYLNGVQELLGVDRSTAGKLMNQLANERAAILAAAAGSDDPSLFFNEAKNDVLSNYAVLYAAQSQAGSNKTTSQYLSDLQKVDVNTMVDMVTSQNEQSKEGITTTAMMYAMYTAYANQLPEGAEKTTALAAAQSTSEFSKHMKDAGFQAYLAGSSYTDAEGVTHDWSKGQSSTDLEGYLGALDIINQSATGNQSAVESLLVNGYTDPTLVSALQGLLGN